MPRPTLRSLLPVLAACACTPAQVDELLGDDSTSAGGSSRTSDDPDGGPGAGPEDGPTTDTSGPSADSTTGPAETGTESATDTAPPQKGGVRGDVDGDGFVDMVSYTAYDDTTFAGRVYVFYGDRFASTLDEADLVIEGPETAANRAVVCDVDGDGIDEIAMGGAYPAVPSSHAVYIYRASGRTTLQYLDSNFSEMSCDDFDGDGLDDIAIGAYGNPSTYSGAGFIPGSSLSLGEEAPAELIPLGDVDGTTATRVAAGDYDGDGIADVVVAKPAADADDGTFEAGVVSVYALSSGNPEVIAVVEGVGESEYFGGNIDVCDIDGDGVADIVDVSAPNASVWTGSGTSDAPDATVPIDGPLSAASCNGSYAGLVLHDGTSTRFVTADLSAETLATQYETSDFLGVQSFGPGGSDGLFVLDAGGTVQACDLAGAPGCTATTSGIGQGFTGAIYGRAAR